MSTFFSDLVEAVKDEDTSILADGHSSGEFSGYVDTGCFMLNAAMSGSLYGGIPNNKVTAFAGESATGKTFFVLSAVKQFLEANPTGGVVYYDTEAAVTREMMESRGIDPSRVIIAEPQTIQQFKTHALKMLDAYIQRDDKKGSAPPMMMVLDSLGLLSTNKELEDSTDGKDVRDMTKSQVIKATFRVLTLKLAKAKVPMLVTNHVYEVIGSYVPTKEMGGGTGLKYAASSIVMLGKKKEKDGKEQIGNIIKVRMHKSRFTKENCQVELLLDFQKGLHKWYGLLEFAEQHGLVERSGARYTFPANEGQASAYAKAIYAEPEKYFTEPVMEAIEYTVNKEFKYGE